MPRFYVRVDLQVDTDDRRLIPVEIEGRLLDEARRPSGLRVEQASVVAVHELDEPDD